MSGNIAPRVGNISSSGTLVIKEKANKLQSEGIEVISFATGEPDFNTPDNIKMAGVKAIADNYTRYTPIDGFKELKEAILSSLLSDYGLKYDLSQIIVANGAKQILFEAFFSIFSKGDKVIIPTPCWVTFPEQLKLAGADPLYVQTKKQNNFKLTLEDIREVFDDNVKGIVLNNPNNPSGAIIDEKELFGIADFITSKNAWIIADEIYHKLIYSQKKHISVASLGEKIKERTILVNGFSKSYAMTGWRVGFTVAPIEIVKAMKKIQGHLTSGISGISQKAATEALLGPQDSVKNMVDIYKKRRDYMVNALNSINGISCMFPEGAFYVFPDVSGVYGKEYKGMKIFNEMDFAKYLLEEAHVAVVPGSSFHYKDHVRLSFATSYEDIKKGSELIKEATERLN